MARPWPRFACFKREKNLKLGLSLAEQVPVSNNMSINQSDSDQSMNEVAEMARAEMAKAMLDRALARLDRVERLGAEWDVNGISNKRVNYYGGVEDKYSWAEMMDFEDSAKAEVKKWKLSLGLIGPDPEPVAVVEVPVATVAPEPLLPAAPIRHGPAPIAAEECRTTYCSLSIRRLPADVIVEDLYKLCPDACDVFISRHKDHPTETHGKPLRKSTYRYDKPWQTQKGAFVKFRTPAQAAAALESLKGATLNCSYSCRRHDLMVEPALRD